MKSNKNKFWIFISVIVTIFLVCYVWYKEGTLPVNKNDASAHPFVVHKGDGLNTIAINLSKDNLIRSRIVFFLVVKELALDKKIQAGNFRLTPSMNTYEIAKALTHGTNDVWVTVFEGLRKEEVAHIISQHFDIPETEFIKDAPEGFLFPDTYLIPSQAGVQDIINLMVNNFNSKYTADMQEKAHKLGLTKDQVITLASIVEREARTYENKQKVASVLLKRYHDNYPLQTDISIQYALGYQPAEKTWWKKEISLDDLAIDSPYNLYKNPGLPPTPLCNPGIDSIKAVVNANPNTPYMFYLTGKDNQMHYAITSEEHQANIKKYL